MKIHHIQIKNKAPGKISTGMNTMILMDGEPLEGVTDLQFKVDARGVAKVTMTMVADVALDAYPKVTRKRNKK